MIVFYKNDFIKDNIVTVDSSSLHFRYGAGFFETLLYNGEQVEDLDRHMERLGTSSSKFGFRPYCFDYAGVTERLISENGLKGSSACVSICHTAETMDEYSVFISATPYEAPPSDKVFSLCLYPHIHDTYLSLHKTMNNMHFLMAKKYAAENNCDDVVLVNKEGLLLETASSAVIFKDGEDYFAPAGANRLKSIALENFRKDNKIRFADIHISAVQGFELFVINSLMGMRKAVLK